MSSENGVIRVGRKGVKKFAFGDDGMPFEVDVVAAFQEWLSIDESIRSQSEDGTIRTEDMPEYHQSAVNFVERLANPGPDYPSPTQLTIAEALDFIARLREQYDEVAVFFRPKSREERESPAISAAELRFSEEPASN